MKVRNLKVLKTHQKQLAASTIADCLKKINYENSKQLLGNT